MPDEMREYTLRHNVKRQLNRGCYFPMQAMLPEDIPFHQFTIN